MICYIEVTLLPDPETPLYYLWSKVYPQVHLALVESQTKECRSEVGMSFPGYLYDEKDLEFTLGNKLRLFAPNSEALEKLTVQKYLSRLTDYIHISLIKDLPANINQYVCFSRVQAKSNINRLARRKAKRENISLEKAFALLDGFKEKSLKEPFIEIKSLSSGHDFRLYIKKQELPQAVTGMFSLYGLSASATVPWFD